MEKKKLAELALAIFIAAAFISSYISNSNYNVPNQTRTTTIPQSVYGQGTTNALITGYGSPLSVRISCSKSINNNATFSNVSSIFANMENNNSISDFYNTNDDFQLVPQNISSYGIYKYFQNSSNQTRFGCMNFTGPAQLLLPAAINLSVAGVSQKVEIPLNGTYRNSTITLSLANGVGTNLRLRVSVLVTANGTLYGPMVVSVIQ